MPHRRVASFFPYMRSWCERVLRANEGLKLKPISGAKTEEVPFWWRPAVAQRRRSPLFGCR